MPDPQSPCPLDLIPPDARLAATVNGADGRIILAAGTPLTPEAIDQLRRSGIATVSLEAPAASADQPESAALARLRQLFRKSAGNPPALDLQRQVAAYRLTAKP